MRADSIVFQLISLVLMVSLAVNAAPAMITDPPARPQHKAIHENYTCYREGFVFRPTNWDEAIVEEQPARSVAFTVQHDPEQMDAPA
jgi:hypothetical protein